MRIILFACFIILLFCDPATSQSIIYEYDHAGNRIKRVYNGGALPVSLISFIAVRQESFALLEWQSAFETGFSHFDLERSADGKTWSTIARIPARADASLSAKYRYTDHDPAGGLNFYRLKMMDHDGSFSYSKLESLFFPLAVSLYPNPIEDFLQIKGGDDFTSVEVFSLNGKLAFRMDRIPDEGIDFRSQSPGIYLIKIYRHTGLVTVQKVIRK